MRSNIFMLLLCLILGIINIAIGVRFPDNFSLNLGIILLLMAPVFAFFAYKDI